jgi:hypothetical protein
MASLTAAEKSACSSRSSESSGSVEVRSPKFDVRSLTMGVTPSKMGLEMGAAVPSGDLRTSAETTNRRSETQAGDCDHPTPLTNAVGSLT